MASTLTSCGTGGSETVTISLVAADYGDSAANSSQRYWDELVQAFEVRHRGIKVDVKVYDWTQVDRKVAELVARDEAPDLAQIGAYADYANAGKLYRADEVLSISAQAAFIPSIERAGEVRRALYGLPFASSARLLFYNKDLFEAAGVDGPPSDWDELKKAATKLKAHGVKYPYALPLGPEEAPAETMLWMLSGGGGYADTNGTYVIDSEQNVKTFEWLRDELVGAGLTGPGAPGRTNRQQVFDAFARGEVGMLNGHPTLMKQATQGGVRYGTAPLPGVDGTSKATMGVADWMMAFRQNGKGEQIGTFLDFVYRDDNVIDFTGQYDLLPVTSTVSEAMREDPNYKRLWQFLDQLEFAEFYPASKPSWAAVSKDVKAKIGAVVSAGGDPAGVLSELQRHADELEVASRANR
ncbi:extracellular solute-binding protein [Streptomyces palmae]|uniref:Extracellular solute-binding protein n=1 Tax=Streptomyces palmae TaxID=1701085 RepID=A0A4Z0GM00_9ACTN|nr:extracellular solute-binding protein [Streptomyces palmae]TGA97097.1 extracellular solute-binding protein [Streptomyces palmae]